MNPNRWTLLLLALIGAAPDAQAIVTNFAAQLATIDNDEAETAAPVANDEILLLEGSPNRAIAWGSGSFPSLQADSRATTGTSSA